MKKFKEILEILEATKWKKGDGRPRGGSHIENVKFWDLPDASLKYIQKDAHDAMKANPKGSKAGKYADEVNDAATVLFWRKKNKITVESVEIDNHVNEIFIDEGFQLNVDTTVAIKVKGKMLYGKVTELEKVEGKPGVVVKWSNGTTGRFKMSAFASIMGDKKADYVISEGVKLKEAKNDASKYTDDKLKAVLKQLKNLDQDAPSTKFMLKKIEKEMKKRGLSEQLEEAKKLKASDIVKIMSDTEEWGSDAKARVYTKGSNFVYIDSFYFNAKKALDNLVTAWSKGGDYHKYFADEYGCDLKVVDSFEEMKATGKHKKLGKDGIVGVEIKVQ